MRVRVSVPRLRRLAAIVSSTIVLAGVQTIAAGSALAASPGCDVITGNLVQNCGFEGGYTSHSGYDTPDGWTVVPAGTSPDAKVTYLSHSGANAFEFGAGSTFDDTLSQVVSGTVAGQAYTLAFWVESFGTNNDFTAKVTDPATLATYSFTDENLTPYTLVTLPFTAGSSAPTISFAGRNPPSWVRLDDVAVVPGTLPASGFPIPTTTTVTATPGARSSAFISVASNGSTPPLLPPGAVPTGSVDLLVNGVDQGDFDLGSDGTVDVPLSLYQTRGGATLTASYGGDGYFGTSTGMYDLPPASSGEVDNPTITAHVHNAHGKHHGWYRSAVTVSFTCTGGSNGLTLPCPGPVTRSKNGRNQQVSKTVYGYGGGSATATVYPINIDTTPPTVTVSGHSCTAHDSLSGPGSCHVVFNGSHWTATGTDRAGNVTVRRG